MPDIYNEGFCIDTDQKAEWALRKIAEAKTELAKWEEFYQRKLEACRADTQSTIDFMMGHLLRYFTAQEHRVTKSGIRKYSLPSGDLVLKPSGIDYQRDDEKMLAWCKEHLPQAVKVTEKAAWADVKAHIKETGEMPDGVTVIETEPVFSIKEE